MTTKLLRGYQITNDMDDGCMEFDLVWVIVGVLTIKC